ncbi:ribulose-phosphate 3-epimerase [Garciella nitratireducens]|uniref:Ribulose-phosphate 3-epimerase n=1 Tax=Garciella nitratireducens DSM 15102 TaxID=1121911 RepID=A0A1T4PCH7_9FIRM|nr:ribulose-phosphate 3-epimerase [Garciella nitratireducens]RBP36155.1 ribulose-5-phosphate 3-epimerase [Garciella nitratireducens]SJZ89222.1 ribulose-5-phosphate 3-epimerase [Garciella nitratireducens DSM 15102]
MLKIAPSLLSADFANLEREIKQLHSLKVDMIHLDMMDGNFVPNITFGPDQIKDLRKTTDLFFDVHMMIQNPDQFIPKIVQAGANGITIHQEATTHLHRSIQLVKDQGVKVGVALNPATSIDSLKYVLDDIDMILLMTVNPGFGGQKFIKVIVEKIKETKKMIGNRSIDLQVDGGINEITAKECIQAGANILVAGSYIFNGEKEKNIRKLKEIQF